MNEEDNDEYEIKQTTFICCSACYETLLEKGSQYSNLWIKACVMFLKYDRVFEIIDRLDPDLRMLETLGFITTTENSDEKDGIIIKINGHQKTDAGTNFFCIGAHDAKT